MAFIHVAALVLSLTCTPPELARRASVSLAAQVDAQTVLEGNLEVLIEDGAQGSRTLYFLNSGNQRVPLRFRRRPIDLVTGTRVRVRGRWEEDHTLAVTSIERI